jgi:hypothetical protein
MGLGLGSNPLTQPIPKNRKKLGTDPCTPQKKVKAKVLNSDFERFFLPFLHKNANKIHKKTTKDEKL